MQLSWASWMSLKGVTTIRPYQALKGLWLYITLTVVSYKGINWKVISSFHHRLLLQEFIFRDIYAADLLSSDVLSIGLNGRKDVSGALLSLLNISSRLFVSLRHASWWRSQVFSRSLLSSLPLCYLLLISWMETGLLPIVLFELPL